MPILPGKSPRHYMRCVLVIGGLLNPPDGCSKVVKGQMERDAQIVDLVNTMEDVYSFVEESNSFRSKIKVLEKTIDEILKQTIECSIFIREYTGHGFGGD